MQVNKKSPTAHNSLKTSRDCNGNAAVAKRRPYWNGKREYLLCEFTVSLQTIFIR